MSIIAKKDERLEHLRVVACFLVILGHISNWYMRAFPQLSLNSYICSLLFNGICRVSVPIFFMISGALILEQQTDYKKNNKRTLSLFIKTIIWIAVFMLWDYLYLGDFYDLGMILTSPIRVHFWFLYVMLGIYITIPLWQKLTEGDSKKLMCYFSVLFLCVLGAKFALNMAKIQVSYEIPLIETSVYAGYFIMGYVLRHYKDEIKIPRWVCALVFLGCAAATTLLTLFESIKMNRHVEIYCDFRSVFIGIGALCVFLFVMKSKEPAHRPWVSVISAHTFNIYMIHVFFLDIIQQNIDITKFTAWLGFPVFFIFLFSLSFGFSFIIGKITKNKI